jgi:hypothetical protein
MRTSYVPLMHCEKMPVTEMSFRQLAVIEFLVTQGNSAELPTRDLQRPNDKAWNGVIAHRPKRSRKQCPPPAKLWESSFGILRGAYWSTFWKNKKRSVQLATFRRFVKNVRRRKLSSFNMTTWGLTLHVWPCRQFKRTAGTALPSTLQSGFGSLRLPLVRALERSPERSLLRDWRGSSGSREKLVPRSWNWLTPQRHF